MIIIGGIILEDNPLVCDCNLLWLSQWMREVFTEMKSINVEAAIHAKSKLSLSQCARPLCYNNAQQYSSTTNITTLPPQQSYVSIIDLRDEDICQQQQQCQQDVSIAWPSLSSSSSSDDRYVNTMFVQLSIVLIFRLFSCNYQLAAIVN